LVLVSVHGFPDLATHPEDCDQAAFAVLSEKVCGTGERSRLGRIVTGFSWREAERAAAEPHLCPWWLR
jgi:hypothetical protein